MKKRKIFALLLLVLLFIGFFTACKKGRDAGVITLRLYESTDNELISRGIAEAFNASQDEIFVENVFIANDDYDDKIMTLLSGGGDIVDIFYLRQLGKVKQYGNNGVILDLAKYLKKSKLDLSRYGSTLTAVQEDGKTFGLPRIKSSWFLFYNKEIFDAERIDYPGQMTWDEYADLAVKLTKVKPDGKKEWGGYFPPWTFNLYALQQGEYLIDDDLTQTKKALEFLNRIYNIDKSHMSTAEMVATSSNPNPEFETGNVAMMINGDWTFLLLGQDEKNGLFDFEWDMAPLPVPNGVTDGTTVGGVSYIAINKKTKHVDAAWKFLEFYSGEDGASIMAKNYCCPAYMTDGAAKQYVASTGHESASLMFQGDTFAEETAHPQYNQIRTLFNDNTNLYLLGEITIDKFEKQFKAQRAEVLAD